MTNKCIDGDIDTELTQHALDLSSRVIVKNPDSILNLEPFNAVEFLILFSIRVLNEKEPLPKAAAADFWVGCRYHIHLLHLMPIHLSFTH